MEYDAECTVMELISLAIQKLQAIIRSPMISKEEICILVQVFCAGAKCPSPHFPSSGTVLELAQTNTHCLSFKNV